jgi:hypothetical protein
MRELALEYGLSDVGLAKVCKRHKIPTPPVGYWSKLRSGKGGEQPPLLKAEASQAEVIITGTDHKEIEFDAVTKTKLDAVGAAIIASKEIKKDMHHLLDGTLAVLKKGGVDKYGRCMQDMVLRLRSYQ